jgi:hypothetical protein
VYSAETFVNSGPFHPNPEFSNCDDEFGVRVERPRIHSGCRCAFVFGRRIVVAAARMDGVVGVGPAEAVH